jgi:oligosaccharide repeat unit polymerase
MSRDAGHSRLRSSPVTVPLTFASILEAASLLLLVVRLRGAIWHHLGALFVMAAVIYHGVAEVLNRFGAPGSERAYLTISELDSWQLLIGPAILIFTIAYLAVLEPAPGERGPKPDKEAIARTTNFLSWKPLAIISAPMYIYILRGGKTALAQGAADHTVAGIIAQFLLIAIVLTSYSFVVTSKKHPIFTVLVIQSALLLLLGERLTVIAAAVMLLYALYRAGFSLARRQIVKALVLLCLASVVISAARVSVSRQAFQSGSGITKRLDAARNGLEHPGNILNGFSQQYYQRIDGNDFGAFVVAGVGNGIAPVGLQTFDNDVRLAIPSALLPGKLSVSVTSLDEEAAIEDQYGMGTTNRLPTVFGTLVAYFGTRWFFALATILGVFFAFADRFLRRQTPVRLVLGVGLMYCVALYEEGIAVYTTTLRGVILLLVVAKAIQIMRMVAPRVRRSVPDDLAVTNKPVTPPKAEPKWDAFAFSGIDGDLLLACS